MAELSSIGILSSEGEYIELKDINGNVAVRVEGKITEQGTFYVSVLVLRDKVESNEC